MRSRPGWLAERPLAASADLHMLGLAADGDRSGMNVRLPGAFGVALGMADVKTGTRRFAADFALQSWCTPLISLVPGTGLLTHDLT